VAPRAASNVRDVWAHALSPIRSSTSVLLSWISAGAGRTVYRASYRCCICAHASGTTRCRRHHAARVIVLSFFPLLRISCTMRRARVAIHVQSSGKKEKKSVSMTVAARRICSAFLRGKHVGSRSGVSRIARCRYRGSACCAAACMALAVLMERRIDAIAAYQVRFHAARRHVFARRAHIFCIFGTIFWRYEDT